MPRRTGLRRQQSTKRRLAIVGILLLLAGIFGAWQLLDLSRYFSRLGEILTIAGNPATTENGGRGKIYDRNFKELAVSLERVSVYARARELHSAEDAVEKLAPVLRKGNKRLLENLKGDSLRIWLARDINQEQEEAIHELDLPGIHLYQEFSRFYPQDKVAAHLIGFVENGVGLAGVEYYFDRLTRKMLAEDMGEQTQDSAAQHLLLTIDLKIQNILEQLVGDIGRGREGVKIGAYAMDAVSGALIAAVQSPSFNPNAYEQFPQQILDSMLLEPTLLPTAFRVVLKDSAGLQKLYEENETVQPWSLGNNRRSLGTELQLWNRLGLGNMVPPDLAGDISESTGLSGYFIEDDDEQRDFGTVPDTLSPLETLTALSSLLNGGNSISPHVVSSIVDVDGELAYSLQAATGNPELEIVHSKVSAEISSMVGSMAVADDLDGATLYDDVRAHRRGADGLENLHNELYFTAIPIKNAELTVLLTIQDPTATVPAKKEIKRVEPQQALAGVISRIAILQQVGKTVSDVAEPGKGNGGNYPLQSSWIGEEGITPGGGQTTALEDSGEMPDLKGRSLRKSLRLLQGKQCKIRIYGTGKVVAQQPAAGTSLAGVGECILRLHQTESVRLDRQE